MLLLFPPLFYAVYTALFAWGQGWLMERLRETPAGSKQAIRQEFALHWIFGAVWVAPLAFCPLFLPWVESGYAVLMALALRFCLFDATLNYAEGTTVFAVGESAITDRILQFIAKASGIPVTVVSAVFRFLVFVGLVALIVYKSAYYVDK